MERRGIHLAKIMDLLPVCPTAMEKAQRLRVGKCVAGTYVFKQTCVLCSHTLRKAYSGHSLCFSKCIFFTDVNIQLLLQVIYVQISWQGYYHFIFSLKMKIHIAILPYTKMGSTLDFACVNC